MWTRRRWSGSSSSLERAGPDDSTRSIRASLSGSVDPAAPCYPAGVVRLVEVRLLEGPNVYRLEPGAKVGVAVGRRRTWYGQREPGAHALVRLGASVPARQGPDPRAPIVPLGRQLPASTDS